MADLSDDPEDDEEPERDAEDRSCPAVAHWIDDEPQRRERGIQMFRDSCPGLAELGITSVVIPYNGYGDEGFVEPPLALQGDAVADLTAELEDQLIGATEWLLPDGWENYSGGFGELTLDVVQRRLHLEHYTRVESTELEREGIAL